MFYLRNLSSQELIRGNPWEFVPGQPIPEQVRKDKKARDAWINNPATNHCVYTFFEGVNGNLRISKLRRDGGGNPVHLCHALCADYDSAADYETVKKFATALPYPPNWIERTLSGNWRFVWLLEEPLIFPSYEFAIHFFETFESFAFNVAHGMIGFDSGAWCEPNRCYTTSGEWTHLHDNKIPANVSRGWLVKASLKFNFSTGEFGTVIPLDKVRPQLEKLFPRFAEWPGDFALNSQGPSFFIDGSTSPKSAIVRDTGLQTFSAHAAKGFYSWKDLLGAAFVKEYEAESIGRAVEGIFHDGRQYFWSGTDGAWYPNEKEDLMRYLRVSRGVSNKHDKSGVSDVDRALEFIRSNQRVAGAAPFVYQPGGVLIRNGRRYLNTSTLKVLSPAEELTTWGAGGNFPWLSNFLERLFDAKGVQLAVLLAWLAWAYQGFYHNKPEAGQVLFIAGPQGVGKTLLNRSIIAPLLGGFAEAGAFLLGEDNFNSELFNSGLWSVDDNEASTTHTKRAKWSSMLKKICANVGLRCNEKFRNATLVEWIGRLIVTCNADEESVRLLPDLSVSILDKLILLRTADKTVEFPERYEVQRILARELPYLARWLLEYQIPEHLKGTARFGVKEFAEKSLYDTATQSSRHASFEEILDDWKCNYFKDKPAEDRWEGTSFQLHAALVANQAAQIAMRDYSVEAVGRHLSALKNKGAQIKIETLSRGTMRVWRIHRDEPAK